MATLDATIIVADDLTGANDTALQYFRSGKNTKIITELDQDFNSDDNTQVWAITTESRNTDKESATEKIDFVCEKLENKLGIENFYKKIDSTLRGNVGCEILSMLNATQKQAAVIVPAYIEENRTTIGGYQLLNGIAIERTQCALDPKAPIYESFIPDILKHSSERNIEDLIEIIGLNSVSKGAAVIVSKLKELVENGKRLIVIDAMSDTDLEQIAFAIKKCGYDILPCGSAGLAQAINRTESPYDKIKHIEHTPNLPRLVVSGSATQLSANQILKLKEEKQNLFCVDIATKDIISGVSEEIVNEISQKLIQGTDVSIHCSAINKEFDNEEIQNLLIDAGIAKSDFPSKITDYLSDLVHEINLFSDFILIVIGGETSFKCAQKLGSKYLEILDAIMPCVPLCIDINGKIIVTKSGNFGTANTLIEIINYFERNKAL